jgi:branched-chain amino acid transport system permease protein
VTTTISQGKSQRSTKGKVGMAVAIVVGVIVAAWILLFANGTPAGSAISDPEEFVVTVLNATTISGLYFVVASGFTLIFGLMRVVNLTHGTLYLLGGYLALNLMQEFVGKQESIRSGELALWQWLGPVLLSALLIGLIGLVIQQVFLRWFQGQEMRETLITIALSVIMADQMVAYFGGLEQSITWPGLLAKFPTVLGVRYPTTRLYILLVAVIVGVSLWAWLQKTRTGMVIRAGVDDTNMVQALGINVQVVFAIAFFVGAALAGLGGGLGGSFSALRPGVDGSWLLNSIIVVIVGGMGSLKGAAAGALLLGFITALAPAYLPPELTNYSVIFTFILLAAVLAVRPYGLFGTPE